MSLPRVDPIPWTVPGPDTKATMAALGRASDPTRSHRSAEGTPQGCIDLDDGGAAATRFAGASIAHGGCMSRPGRSANGARFVGPTRGAPLEHARDGESRRTQSHGDQPHLAYVWAAAASERAVHTVHRPAARREGPRYRRPVSGSPRVCSGVLRGRETQIQALDRTQPLLPMQPGQVEHRTHDSNAKARRHCSPRSMRRRPEVARRPHHHGQIRRGTFRSVPQLKAAIQEFIDAHQADPKPFVWTKAPMRSSPASPA